MKGMEKCFLFANWLKQRGSRVAVKYLLQNCYFKLAYSILRQNIGIPVSSDPAPFIVNLFLQCYESSWIRQFRKSEIRWVWRFPNVFRLIDDLTAINDEEEFKRSYKEIHLPEVEIKRKSKSYSEGSFIDLGIKNWT